MDIRFTNSSVYVSDAEVAFTGVSPDGDCSFLFNGHKTTGKIENIEKIPSLTCDIPYVADIAHDSKGCRVRIKKELQPIVKTNEHTTHPSWGVVSLGHVSSGRKKLFGAVTYYGSHYSLTVKQAEIYGDDNPAKDYLHSGRVLVEIAMTKEQLLNLISATNSDAGETPCTIEYFNGQHITYQRESFNSLEREIEILTKEWKQSNTQLEECLNQLKENIDQKLTKEARASVIALANKFSSLVNGTMQYNIESLMGKIEKLGAVRQVNMPPASLTSFKMHIAKLLHDEFPDLLLTEALDAGSTADWDYEQARRIVKERRK